MGDYVLTGGELPAMVMTDAIVRLIPGVLGNQQSHEDDSFQDGLLEFPQYTRPRSYQDMNVPEYYCQEIMHILINGVMSKTDTYMGKASRFIRKLSTYG